MDGRQNSDPKGALEYEHDGSTPAPGNLELVRSFLSVHDHEPGNPGSLPPGAEMLAGWLTHNDLVDPSEVMAGDLPWAIQVHAALRTKVSENDGQPQDLAAIELLNDAARRTGLRLCFGCEDGSRIHTDLGGVDRAIGTLLGYAFLAELDGSWTRLHQCGSPICVSIFYDRTKNHSAKWCSMESCGNRNKVRRYRERQAAAAASSG